MNEASAISLRHVSKVYRMWNSPEARLQSIFWQGLGRKDRAQGLYRDFHALSEINLEIPRGQSLGIIGLNGSGKSTLLQMIAGTLQPSTGEVKLCGRLAALLELGAGFNPEFSGRDNVYLNAAVLGLTRQEVDARFPAIAAFADIGDFIEQPVKIYSSGMYIRLAFAVLTQVDPEILIIDEALAVGDFLFQQKCYDRIREFRKKGCTFLFVTHGMGTVLELCDRVIVLDRGKMIFEGDPKAAVDLYEAHSLRSRFGISPPPPVPAAAGAATAPPLSIAPTSNGGIPAPTADTPPELITPAAEPAITSAMVSLHKVSVLDVAGQEKELVASGENVQIAISVLFNSPVRDPHIGFKLRNQLGVVFYETNTYCMRQFPGAAAAGEILTAEFTMRLPLIEGEYSITAAVANEGRDGHDFAEALHYQHEARHFVVTCDRNLHKWNGLFNFMPTVSLSRQTKP